MNGYISTHTPLTGRDIGKLMSIRTSIAFLLTRPLRDVTIIPAVLQPIREISTHTPLTGRDGRSKRSYGGSAGFLLTRPLRDVTRWAYANNGYLKISTHTPLTGRDMMAAKMESAVTDFYSHAPYGT